MKLELSVEDNNRSTSSVAGAGAEAWVGEQPCDCCSADDHTGVLRDGRRIPNANDTPTPPQRQQPVEHDVRGVDRNINRQARLQNTHARNQPVSMRPYLDTVQ